MKLNKNFFLILALLVVVASLYRVFPRPINFAPHIAMALFGGAVIRNRKWAFALPLLSMLLSDILYQFLYLFGLTDIQGFYQGQLVNYAVIASVTVVGFFIRRINVQNILLGAVIAPTWYFIISNFFVWLGNGGYQRPKTFEGLMMCYADAWPFYGNSVLACLLFSALLFGGYFLLRSKQRAIG